MDLSSSTFRGDETPDTTTAPPVLKVVHVIDTLNVGGAEMLLPELCRHQATANIDSTVVALRPGSRSDVAEVLEELGIPVEIVATEKRRQMLDLRRIIRLKHFFETGGYDVVHTHLRVATIFGAIAGYWAGLPVVTTLHNVRTDVGTGLVNRIKDFLETQVLRRRVSVAIACGPTVAESNAERVRPTLQETVANPVRDIPKIPEQKRQSLRRDLLDERAGPLFLAVGRLTRQKAFDVLVEAFADVLEWIPEARLVIVGEGEERNSLESKVSELGLEDQVVLPGVRDDIPALLRATDVFVMSSRWEGLPVALLEAMSAECAIVATTVGDIAWTVGDTATLVEPESSASLAQALISIALDPVSGRSQGQRARSRAEQRHSPLAWIQSLRRVYDQAIRHTTTRQRNPHA